MNWRSEKTRINFFLAIILIFSFSAVLKNLGHTAITYWDEGFHAIVARNLTKHPLKFTLYDQPWLPFGYKDWGNNHIWLHKPPLAMWKIAISFSIFGINTFALRLPSAILATIAVWLTFRIASDLFDKKTGLIAAFLQAFNPFLFGSIHGYRYSDHIDICLLFWVEVSCWLLIRAIKTGKIKNYVLCGIAQGLAYLSKSYLALITFGIVFAVWLGGRIRILNPSETKIRLRDLGVQLLSSILTILPWTIFCLIRHRNEFLWEHKRVIDHLNTDVESWGATWDRHLFDYMILFYPVFYAVIIASVIGLIAVFLKRRIKKQGDLLPQFFVVTWAIGVIVPHSIAVTKTPSATMIAVPALLIGFASIIGRAWRRGDYFYSIFWSMSMIAITLINGKNFVRGRDQFDKLKKFAPFLETNFWIIWQLIAIAILSGVLILIWRSVKSLAWRKRIRFLLRVSAICLSIFYANGYVKSAINVTKWNKNHPLYQAIGDKIQREFSDNACFFIDHPNYGTHFYLMFNADRSVYQTVKRGKNQEIIEKDLDDLAEKVRNAGGIPYLVGIVGKTYDYRLIVNDEVEIGEGKKKRYQIYEMR